MRINNYKSIGIALIATVALAGCGGSGDSNNDHNSNNDNGDPNVTPPPTGSAINASAGGPTGSAGDCNTKTKGVNWDALMTANCRNLSDYNLFSNPADPTSAPTKGAVPYDLSTALFSDYTSKYRFVFVPAGTQVTYSEHEALVFPVGTVISKTFALPKNTAFRDDNELVIETRLLIHRKNGWMALPYYWHSETDAQLAIAGKTLRNMSTIHKGAEINFDYSVPTAGACSSCHAVMPTRLDPDEKSDQLFIPIGPKARFLNKDYTYADGTIYNQLQYWEDQGLLTGLPADMQSVKKAPLFTDGTVISALSPETLHNTAKAYLDVNCAHCHRSELSLPGYAGAAGGSGLQVEYNRAYEDDPGKFGTCKVPIAAGHPDYPNDVVPGRADKSYLLFRMTTLVQPHRMPELARNTEHKEGIELIKTWINQLPQASCSPS